MNFIPRRQTVVFFVDVSAESELPFIGTRLVGILTMNWQRVLVNATRSFELQNLNIFPAGARYQERILAGSKWLGKLL